MKKLIFLSFIILSTSQILYAQNVMWANGITNSDWMISVKNICTDNSGDNYAAGTFYQTVDFDLGVGNDTLSADAISGNINTRASFVTKTDNAGNHIWAKGIIPYTAGYSEVFDVAADNVGNAYIVGRYLYTVDFDPGPAVDSLDSHLTQGAFVVKLDPAGNLLWAKTFQGLYTTMFTVKTDQNNHVIIGGLFGDTVDFDPGPSVYNMIPLDFGEVFLLKLDSNGGFLWANKWDDSHQNVTMYLRENLDIDSSNNIYVSGGIDGTQIDLDPGVAIITDSGKTFSVKLDPLGNFVWGNASVEKSCVIKVSRNRELYTAGEYPVPAYQATTLSKYDSAGTQIWTKTIENPLLPAQYLGLITSSITEDSLGNVIIAGKYGGKYMLYNADSAGNFLWIKKSNASAFINELCAEVNTSNDLMLAGDFRNEFDIDFGPAVHTVGDSGKYAFFLMKYNYCGNNFTFNYNACDSLVLPDTTLYASANYVAEYLDVTNCDSNLFIHAVVNVLKDTVINVCDSVVYNGQTYTQSGVYYQIFPPFLPGCDSIKKIAVNINTPSVVPPILNLIQTFQPVYPPVPTSNLPLSYNIEIDSLYNMYISGTFSYEIDFNPLGTPYLDTSYSAYYQPDGFVTRYDSSGVLNWMHQLYTINAWGNEYTQSLCLNDGLELYSVTYGSGGANIGMNKVNQFAYSNTWYGETPMNGYSGWNVNQVLNDPTSNLPVKIGFMDSIDFNYAYKKLLVWRGNNVATFATGGQFIGLNGVVDSQGNIYVINSVQPVFGGTTYCAIAKIDSNLNMIWNKQIAAGMEINQIKIDSGGSLLLCGRFMATIDIDISPATYNLVTNGDYDAFIAKFDTSANFIWAHSFGGATDDAASSIITDLNGKIYVGGNFASPSIDLDPSTGVTFLMKNCVNTNWQGGYISKFKPDGTFMSGMGSGKNITELEFKAPNRIYATGIPFVQVFELGNDVIVNVSDTICAGDSLVVGNSVYYQSGVYIDIFAMAPGIDSIVNTNLTVISNMIMANASDTSLCLGDSVILNGSGGISYTWNNLVSDSIAFSPIVTNTYIVSGVGVNGCMGQDTITIFVNQLPTVMANATDIVVCFGDSLIISGSGALTYIWNNLAIDSVLFAPIATAYYVVTGTDNNGCTNQDSIEIIVNALPIVMALATDTTLCAGDSILLHGSGANTYLWNNLVIDSIQFSPNITNNYVVVGIDSNGCINTDSITVSVNTLPNVVANASDTSFCVGNPVTLFGTGADSFSWSNNVLDSLLFYPIDTATYVVTGIDINGCVNRDSISVFVNQIPIPILVFSGDTIYCTNVSNLNVYWFKDTVLVDSLINYYVVTQNGNYQVVVQDSNGCIGADSISMLNVGIPALKKNDLIQVYPNPTQGKINIALDYNSVADISLFITDLLGNKRGNIVTQKLQQGKQQLTIDLAHYQIPPGVYFLHMIVNGTRHVVKVEYRNF